MYLFVSLFFRMPLKTDVSTLCQSRVFIPVCCLTKAFLSLAAMLAFLTLIRASPETTVQVQDSQHRQTKHLELVQWLSWAQSTFSSVIIYQPHGASALFFHVHEDQDPVATRIPAEAAPHSRFFFLLFIWLHRILVVAHRTFDLCCHCSIFLAASQKLLFVPSGI